MYKVPLPFTLLTCCGYWRPTEWPRRSFKYWLYNIYSLFTIASLYFLAFCACVNSLTKTDVDTLVDELSVSLSVFRVCAQLPFLFFQRDQIISLLNTVQKRNCMQEDNEEVVIKQRNDKFARKLTIYCEAMNELTVIITPVLRYNDTVRIRTLPRFNWLPYSVTSMELYIVSLLNQVISFTFCASTSVAIETMFAGLMIESKTQFEVFCHRVRNLPATLMENKGNSASEENLKRKWHKIRGNLINDHQEIIDFTRAINATFKYIIVIQFLVSSAVLCLTIYRMSKIDLFNADGYLYLGCMLMEIYLYCWFGNEMTLKSDEACEAVYEMNWTILPTDITKDLLLIMIRSKRPTQISCGHVIVLSVESFMSIIKITYSMYNLMKSNNDE